MKYQVTVGPQATGRDKETNKRQFAFRVSDSTRLVFTADPTVIDIDPVKQSAVLSNLEALAVRGFVEIEEVDSSAKALKPADTKPTGGK